MKNAIILGIVLCFVFSFAGCSTDRQYSILSANSSSVTSNLSGTASISPAIRNDLVEGKNDISVMYGYPDIVVTANDENAALKQITYVQSQAFYDWMYNKKWLPSFHT